METSFLIVPGYTNSGPEHWQSYIERKYSNVSRVVQDDWNTLDKETWVACLDAFIKQTPGNIVLVGHSCGAVAVAQWASLYSEQRVKAAVLVAPADVDSATALEEIRQQRPLPAQRIAFPTLLICSDNDEHLSLDKAHTLAAAWGSEITVISKAGHMNTAAGYGEWIAGEEMIENFTGEKLIESRATLCN
ncbi:alpha/beta hydrolase [Rouxiella badensis]|jgi:predicted alpha/beta hydrolase family esterase|uniref:RBBP9/YdeN family alpha/beta hydrolase n=1 Tax=Rouxiella badensis TaxID=1646377 RepID=UPI0013EEF445|nr:alpha/beta hydrolase [Rouxiella badensis]MCC3735505.1 alpha/beta hydrolase [Rouxiella badensis]MCC3760802.1 alpha/beta hydrolase [Rouxiella badensis]QII38794.1 alpha/beta hydrolase [Rouxiella badensis]